MSGFNGFCKRREHLNGHITSRMWGIQFAIKVMMSLTNSAVGCSFDFLSLCAACIDAKRCVCLPLSQRNAHQSPSWPKFRARSPAPFSPSLTVHTEQNSKLITYNFRVPKIWKVLMDDLVRHTRTHSPETTTTATKCLWSVSNSTFFGSKSLQRSHVCEICV